MKIRNSKRAGYTLIEIMIVVAIIAMLAAMAVAYFSRSREEATKRECIQNLLQIYSAKVRWALDGNKRVTDVPDDSDLIGATLYLRRKPVCPSGGLYDYQQVDLHPTCDKPGHTMP